MKGSKSAILALALALAAGPLLAGDKVATAGGNSVRLKDEPCSSAAVLARIHEDPDLPADEFKAATAVLQGQRFEVCWREFEGGAHLVYEDGDQGVIPPAAIESELSI